MGIFQDPALNLAIAMAKYPLSKAEINDLIPLRDTIPDWKRFLFWVRRHEINGVVLENSRIAGDGFLPLNIHHKLSLQQQQNTVQYMELQRLLAETNEHFDRAGLKFSAIKGIILSEQLYRSIAVRSSGDLDILVGRDDVQKVENLLLGLGFERFHPAIAPGALQRRIYMKYMYHFVFKKPGTNLLIEVHWAIMKPYLISAAETQRWVERGVTVDILPCRVKTLSIEDNFVYLAVHAARHQWASAKYLTDLMAIIQDPLVNWEKILETVRTNRVENIITTNLQILHDLYGILTPEELKKLGGKSHIVNRLAASAIRGLENPKNPEKSKDTLQKIINEFYFKSGFEYKLFLASSIMTASIWRFIVRMKKDAA